MRALVVAYYFPPIGGGGVNRSLRFVRGLAATGIEPWVLTVDDAAWTQDASLVAQIPPRARILRLPNPDWGRVTTRTAAPSAGGEGSLAGGGARRRVARRPPGRLRRWMIPDLHVGWSALAAPVAACLAAARAVDVVYTTCPPYSAHAAGLAAQMAGVPWLADFRDSWTDCPTRLDFPSWRQKLERGLEAAVLSRADGVLFASDGARERALARVPGLAERSETVLTGFDEREFAPFRALRPAAGRLELVHAGSVLLNHMGDCFDRLLRTLRVWTVREPEIRHSLRVCFVGGEPELTQRAGQAGLEGIVTREPARPKARLGERLARAHACLALSAPVRFGADPIPGKTFDAVGADRPLLALTPPGALARLVEELGLGAVARPDDPDAILRVLRGWRRRVLAGQRIPGPPPEARARLNNDRAVERMRDALERARSRRARERGPCPSPSAS